MSTPSNISLTLAILKKTILKQVNLSSTEGDVGILAKHVPTVLELKPSVISLISETTTEKYFVSGGFAAINPDSSLNINAVEAFKLGDLDFEAAQKSLEAAKKLASSSDQFEKGTGLIQVELLEAVIAAGKA